MARLWGARGEDGLEDAAAADPQDPDELARARRAKRFARRAKAAEAGLHLPSLEELLRGMPFLSDRLTADAQAFAERLLPRVPDAHRVRDLLAALTLQPSLDDIRRLALLLRRHSGDRAFARIDAATSAQRCFFYAACLDCRRAAGQVAAAAVNLARAPGTFDDEAYDFALAAAGWATLATVYRPVSRGQAQMPIDSGAGTRIRGWVSDGGGQLIERVYAEKRRQLRGPVVERLSEEGTSANEEGGEKAARPPSLVVVRALGNPETSEGKRVIKEFKELLDVALPLTPVPDLQRAREMLVRDYPYAAAVVERILGQLAGRPHVALRPMILVGEPGCGKTAFASTLLRTLNVRFEIYSCGGVSDSSLAGTPRRWSSGEPSLPVNLIRRFNTASPGIILDEIEKIGTGRHNGNLRDALLGLLERESARHWHDPYVEAAVDLSAVLWLGTANSLDGLPATLRDRCQIVPFPSPGPEYLEALAGGILRRLVIERGLDERWALPLDGEELAALEKAWPGGSLRRLARLVEGILDLRDSGAGKH